MFVGGGGGEEVCLWERERERREVFVGGREVFYRWVVNSTPHFARITRAIFLARGSSCSVLCVASKIVIVQRACHVPHVARPATSFSYIENSYLVLFVVPF